MTENTTPDNIPDVVPDNGPKITTKKEKDPRRVEMGKKLAELARAARERKKIMSELDSNHKESYIGSNTGYLIGLVGLVIAIGSLYYSRLEYKMEVKQDKMMEPKTVPKENKMEPKQNKSKGDFMEL